MKELYKRLGEPVTLKIFDKKLTGVISQIECIKDGVVVTIQFSGMGTQTPFFIDGRTLPKEGCPKTYEFKIGLWNRFLGSK